MTTLSAGFSLGDDDISSSRDSAFKDSLQRRNYRFGASQILSKSLLLNLNYESIVDEGYLQNPYRKIIETSCSVAAPDLQSCPLANRSAALADENYPRTRNSDAFSLKLSWHLPWDGALKIKQGYFSDSWGIEGLNLSFDYTHRFSDQLIGDLRLRGYLQSDADFYANQFFTGAATTPTFRARDKELSEHSSYSIGAGLSYRRELDSLLSSLEVNGQLDYFVFDYDNFLEYRSTPTGDVLSAPRYGFSAYALRLFLTARY